ncbi:hypothetical protein O3P69_014458 [Scylla paramamosain]|uniref:Uncharacterized protein n=1 Tax=Scylla paramamosain TaxID=85552 RepID=A0AAW0TBG0_SCYPA
MVRCAGRQVRRGGFDHSPVISPRHVCYLRCQFTQALCRLWSFWEEEEEEEEEGGHLASHCPGSSVRGSSPQNSVIKQEKQRPHLCSEVLFYTVFDTRIRAGVDVRDESGEAEAVAGCASQYPTQPPNRTHASLRPPEPPSRTTPIAGRTPSRRSLGRVTRPRHPK